MMRYSFWHGRGYTIGDLTWLVQAFKLLKNNEWNPDTPLYFDGSGWESNVREAAAISLLNALAANETARILYLQNADLDLKAQKALTRVFSENSSLTKVSLKNLLCNDGFMTVPQALFGNMQLENLAISECALDDQGCHLLCNMLKSSAKLKTLSLTKITLSDKGLAALCAGLKSSPFLRTLDLRGIQLSATARAKLLRALGQNTSITSLVLEKMNLCANDAKALARMVARNTTIHTLSLRRNSLSGDSVRIFMNYGLQRNSMLRTLKLSSNPVGDDGARHIADALQHQHTLQSLCLFQTNITRQGCVALCKGLETMQGLRHIALDGNDIDECGSALLQAVQANVHIHSILEGIDFNIKHADETALWKKIEMYLLMNKANRRIVREENACDGILCRVLSTNSSNPNFVFELLKQMPAYTANAGA